MKVYVITLFGNDYSEYCAQRCIDSCNQPVIPFRAVQAREALEMLDSEGLLWTWGPGYFNMEHKPYGGDHASRVGCFLSHYFLWKRCVDEGPMLILEHDAVFVRPFYPFPFSGACQINDPRGATPKGDWWRDRMVERGSGIWPKTRVFDDTRPDGLAGNSAYCLLPETARMLIELVQTIGAWPNDAIMCRQLVPHLEEVYPFITEVQSQESTIR